MSGAGEPSGEFDPSFPNVDPDGLANVARPQQRAVLEALLRASTGWACSGDTFLTIQVLAVDAGMPSGLVDEVARNVIRECGLYGYSTFTERDAELGGDLSVDDDIADDDSSADDSDDDGFEWGDS